jgi:hypothetical protein
MSSAWLGIGNWKQVILQPLPAGCNSHIIYLTFIHAPTLIVLELLSNPQLLCGIPRCGLFARADGCPLKP